MTIRCLACNYPITWAEQRQQYARAIRYGFSPDEAKRIIPRCYRCVAILLRTMVITPVSDGDEGPSPPGQCGQ
jgi:hypothetical protein